MTSKGWIIVIDDCQESAALLAKWAERGGYYVQTYTEAEEAEERIRDNDIEALVMDVRMTPKGGLTIARQLRDDGIGVPILLVSGQLEPEDTRAANAIRACRVYSKDGQEENFNQALEELTGRHRVEYQLALFGNTLGEVKDSVAPEQISKIVKGAVEKISWIEYLKITIQSKLFWFFFMTIGAWAVNVHFHMSKPGHGFALENISILKEDVHSIRTEQRVIREDIGEIKTLLKKGN